MFSKHKPHKRFTRLITEADVEYVSLVQHGANQTPFRYLKADPLKVNRSKDETDVSRPIVKNYLFHSLEFKKQNFDKDDVINYLDELGIDDYEIEDDKSIYIAVSKFADKFDESTIQKIQGNQAGVTVKAGSLKEDVDVEELLKTFSKVENQSQEEKNVEKDTKKPALVKINDMSSAEIVQKYNEWIAVYSTDKELSGTLDYGMSDGLPPGAYDMSQAYWVTVSNALRDRDMDAIKRAGTELGELVAAISQVFTNYIDSNKSEDEMVMSKLFQKAFFRKSEDAENQKAEETKVEKNEDAEATDETATASDNESTDKKEDSANVKKDEDAKKDATDSEKSETTESNETSNEDVEEKVEKSANNDSEIMKAISQLSDVVVALGEKVSKMDEKFETNIQKSDERLEQLEGISKTRRSEDPTDEEVSNKEDTEEVQKGFVVNERLAKLWGLRT